MSKTRRIATKSPLTFKEDVTPPREPLIFMGDKKPVDRLGKLRKHATEKLERARKHIEEFAAKVLVNPQREMEWCGSSFKAAAEIHVFTIVLLPKKDISDEEIIEAIRSYALDCCLRIARNPPRSSGQTNNLMEQAVGEVWAELHETMRWSYEPLA